MVEVRMVRVGFEGVEWDEIEWEEVDIYRRWNSKETKFES